MIRSMAKEIRMPKLAQTSEEVRLLRWLVTEGDSVKKGDPLCEVENDKTTMDLESFADGTVLRLLVAADSEVTAGTVIALIGEPGQAPVEVPPQKPAASGPRIETPAPGASDRPAGGAMASRLVRNLAQKRGIELAAVRGTGPSGIVTRKDLDRAVSGHAAVPAKETSIPLSDLQIQLGRLMTDGKARIPHYYLESTILCDRLLDLRERKRSRNGDKLTLDAFFIFAAASVLSRQPRINASLREGSLYSSGQAQHCLRHLGTK